MIGHETRDRSPEIALATNGDGSMFFLLRVAFWLSLAILFIPADPQISAENGRDVSTIEAIGEIGRASCRERVS
jgi:hypothetical protein